MRTIMIVALLFAVTSARAADPQGDAWQVESNPSALDPASSRATASLKSSNQIPNAIGSLENARLIYRCTGSGSAELYVAWPGFIGIDNQQVRFKVGDGPIRTEYWSTSTDGTASFESASRVVPLVRELMAAADHTVLVVRVEPDDRAAQEAQFDLTGTAAAVAATAPVCGGSQADRR